MARRRLFTGLENLKVDPNRGLILPVKTAYTPYQTEDGFQQRMTEDLKQTRFALLEAQKSGAMPEWWNSGVMSNEQRRLIYPEFFGGPAPSALDYSPDYKPQGWDTRGQNMGQSSVNQKGEVTGFTGSRPGQTVTAAMSWTGTDRPEFRQWAKENNFDLQKLNILNSQPQVAWESFLQARGVSAADAARTRLAGKKFYPFVGDATLTPEQKDTIRKRVLAANPTAAPEDIEAEWDQTVSEMGPRGVGEPGTVDNNGQITPPTYFRTEAELSYWQGTKLGTGAEGKTNLIGMTAKGEPATDEDVIAYWSTPIVDESFGEYVKGGKGQVRGISADWLNYLKTLPFAVATGVTEIDGHRMATLSTGVVIPVPDFVDKVDDMSETGTLPPEEVVARLPPGSIFLGISKSDRNGQTTIDYLPAEYLMSVASDPVVVDAINEGTIPPPESFESRTLTNENVQALKYWLEESEQNEGEFLSLMWQIGRTPQLEDLMQKLLPNDYQAVLDSIFSLQFPQDDQIGTGTPQPEQPPAQRGGVVRPPKLDETAQRAMAPVDRAENKLKDIWDAFILSGRTSWEQTKGAFTRTLPNAMFQDVEVPERQSWDEALAKYKDDVAAGKDEQTAMAEFMASVNVGEVAGKRANEINQTNRQLRDTFRRIHAKSTAEFEQWVSAHPEYAPREEWQKNPSENWSLLTDPGYWGYQIAQAAPYMVAVTGTTLAVSAITKNPALGLMTGMAVATPVVTTQLEDDLLANGASEEQAAQLATMIGPLIGGIESVSDLPFLRAVGPGIMAMFKKEAGKEMAKLTARQLIKKGVATAGKVELSETLEEVVQQAIQNATVKTVNENRSLIEGLTDTAIIAGIASAPFALVGGISVTKPMFTKAVSSLKGDLKTQFEDVLTSWIEDGVDPQTAQVLAMNDVAKTPEGKSFLKALLEGERGSTSAEKPEYQVKQEPGTPEAGMQSGMFGEQKEVRPKGKGQVVQISMMDALKLERQKAGEAVFKDTKPGRMMTAAKEEALTSISKAIQDTHGNIEEAKRIVQRNMDLANQEQGNRSMPFHGAAKNAFPQYDTKSLEVLSQTYEGWLKSMGEDVLPTAEESLAKMRAETPPLVKGGQGVEVSGTKQAIVEGGQTPTVKEKLTVPPVSEGVPPVEPPKPPETATAVPEPEPKKPTQVQKVRQFYKSKIADLKGAIQDKVASLKDWHNYTLEERTRILQEVMTEKLGNLKGITEDMRESLIDWAKYGVEQQKRVGQENLANLQGVLEDTTVSLKDWAKYNVSERARVKAILVDYIQENLPLTERGKLLDAVKNVSNQEQLDEVLVRVDTLAEVSIQKQLRTQIDKELAKTKPKKTEGILKGKFVPEVQDWLDTVRANAHVDRDEARAKIADIIQLHSTNKITEEAMREQIEALSHAGIDGMNSDELQEVLDDIKSFKEVGKTLRRQKEEQLQERVAAMKETAIKETTGGKGLKPGTGVLDARELEAKQGALGRLVDNQLAFGNLLDEISKLSATVPYQSGISKFERSVQQARNEENSGLNLYQQLIINRFAQIYGLKNASEINARLNQLETEKVDLGDFKVGKDTVHMEKTKAQIIQHYLWQQDPTLIDTYKEGMHWTYEINSAMANSLSEQDVQFADSVMEFYRDYYPSIDTVYKELYGVHLPNNPNYSPLLRDFDSAQPENVMMYKDLAHYASVMNGSLKSRVKNIVPLHDTSVTANLINHVEQMEHFKAWSFPMRDMRRVFGDKNVRTAIQQYHGKPILKKIDDYLDLFARGGVDRVQIIRGLDKLRGNFSTAVLGLKPHIAIQQIPTILGYTTEMPMGDFFSGIGDYLKHPVENFKWMMTHSEYIKARYEMGFERDIRTAITQKGIADWSGKSSFTEKVYFLIQSGDKLGVLPGWWAKYKSGLKAGLSEKDAMLEADLSTNRTQNSGDVETLSTLQNGGSWMKLLTMFQNQPNKYFRIMADNMRNMKYGRGDKQKAALNILMVGVVLPTIYGLIANAFRFRRDDAIKEAALSPVNNLLIFGNMARAIEGWLAKETYAYQVSPVLDTMQEIQNAISKAQKMVRDGLDPFKDIAVDDVINVTEFLGKAGGQLAGLPTPYLINVERALRGTKTKTGETERDLRELVFSRWALGKVDRPEIQQQLETATEGLGQVVELTEKQKEAQRKAGVSLEPRMKGMVGLSSDFRKVLGHLLHEDITEKNGYSKLAVSWSEMEATRDDSDVLPDIKLKDYVNEDWTPEQLAKQWQARTQIKSLQQLKEYDSVWTRAELGNLSRRQVELIQKYIGADPETQKQMVKDNPELNQVPRDEWLRANPEGNARQALWGQAKPLTQAAYDKMWELAKTLDIPDSAMPTDIPPREIAKTYFGYQDLLKTVEAGSTEAKLFRVDNPEFDKWGQKANGWQPVDIKSLDAARLTVKNKAKEEELNAIKGRDVNETNKLRDEWKAKNEPYMEDLAKIEADTIGLAGNLVETHVLKDKMQRQDKFKDYEDDWFWSEHPDYYQKMVALGPEKGGIKQKDFSLTPTRSIASKIEYWNALPGDKARDVYLSKNDDLKEYEVKVKAKEAVTKGFTGPNVQTYAQYYTTPHTGYEDDWFMQEHQSFFNAGVKLGVWKGRDFAAVPSRAIAAIWEKYQKIPAGPLAAKRRRAMRQSNAAFNAWLIKFKGYKALTVARPAVTTKKAVAVSAFR